MKILFDTNVFVSAVLSGGGHCSEIIDHAVHEHELYTTTFILDELKKVFREEDFRFAEKPAGELLQFIKQFYILGQTAAIVDPICRDPNDDQILADAFTNDIDIIITGDKDLLDLKNHKGIRILAPRDYWTL